MYVYAATATSNNDLWLDDFESAPTVHIAHIAQNIRNTSASVTRITHEDIRRWELRDWHDALRLVPGMTVVKRSAPRSSIDYNASGVSMGSGLEILVDGVRQTIPAQSTAFIQLLPPLELVDSIEIVRGSNAAADGGSVSFKGTIHITTRSPGYRDRSYVLAQLDSRKNYRSLAYYNNNHKRHHFSVMAQYHQSNGFDRRSKFDSEDLEPVNPDINDAMDTNHLHMQYSHRPGNNTSINVHARITNGNFTIPGTTLVSDRVPDDDPVDSDNYAAAVTIEHWLSDRQRVTTHLSHQHWRWRQNASICGPSVFLSPEARVFIEAHPEQLSRLMLLDIDNIPSSPELQDLISAFLSDPSSTCAKRPQSYDIDRTRFTAQYLAQWEKLHWINGIDLATNSLHRPQFGSTNDYNNTQLFSHLQWNAHKRLTANIGARFEVFDNNHGWSGRSGLNIHLNPQATLRLVGSYSEKLPDIVDIDDNFKQLRLITDTPVYGNTKHDILDGNLLPTNESAQTVQSVEAGLFWQLPLRNTADFRLFHDRMRNISTYDIALVSVPPAENTNKVGAEIQLQGELHNARYNLSLFYHHSNSDQEAGEYDRYGLSFSNSIPISESGSIIAKAYYTYADLVINNQQRDHMINIYSIGLKQHVNQQLAITLTTRYDNTNFTNHLYLPETNKAGYDNKGSIIYTIEYTF